MFALFDTSTDQIIQGPWRELPGRFSWPDTNFQISPLHVGAQHGDILVVQVIDQDRPPSRFHSETNRSEAREGNVLTISRSFSETGMPSVFEIKSEARRRILEQYPAWKQANMMARAVELQDLWRQNGAWTAAEQSEAEAIQTAWDWIKSVRNLSGALEPNPSNDFEDDSHWTVS